MLTWVNTAASFGWMDLVIRGERTAFVDRWHEIHEFQRGLRE